MNISNQNNQLKTDLSVWIIASWTRFVVN